MGPKKKGKGKKDRQKGSGEKKKDGNVHTLTFNEAVMMHQLEVKLAQVNDLKDDLDDLRFRNDRQRQRNQFLTKEQNRHVKSVLEQAHGLAKVAESKEKIPYEDVEKALQGKLASIRAEEQVAEDLKQKIASMEDKIASLGRELEQVKNYKEQGQHVDQTHIQVLNKEMVDMDQSYTEISDFFEKSLIAVKHSITKKNEAGINNQKKLVSEFAIQNLDGNTETEFLDNKWLHKEVDIHRRHIKSVEREVEILEQHNIEIMSELFDKQMEDVIQTKQFYMACKEAETDFGEPLKTKAVVCYDGETNIEYNGEEVFAEHFDDDKDYGSEGDFLDHYLTEFDDIPQEEDYKLGPMEIKLLCVYGQKMKIAQLQPDKFNGGENGRKFSKFKAVREELTITK